MKNSFQLEIPYETMEAIVEHFEPKDGIDILVECFKEALMNYIGYIIEEGGDIEDETCLS